jgi:hypothetical protein
MSLNIAFSGASHSGKTTKIEELMVHYGSKLIVSDEIIRSKNINIKDVRENDNVYLDFEIDVISQKIKTDFEYFEKYKNEDVIVLTDRSIFDSINYWLLYLKPSALDNERLKKFHDFNHELFTSVLEHYLNNLDFIFFFDKIETVDTKLEEDQYRELNLKYMQDAEYHLIKSLTFGSFPQHRVYPVNVKKDDLKFFIGLIETWRSVK